MGKKKDLKIERQQDEQKFTIFQLPNYPRENTSDIGFGSEEEHQEYRELFKSIKEDINKDSKIIKFKLEVKQKIKIGK
jgi:hypothetical protein